MHARMAGGAVMFLAVFVSVGAAQTGQLTVHQVPSPAVGENLIGGPSEVEVAVYTPPGYVETTRRFPVIYLLHGILGTYRDWTQGGYQGLRIHTELDSLISGGDLPPLVVVMPTAMNRYGGSFYADSPVTGGWGRFMAEELVDWVDSSYRTIPEPEARAIVGHSMGGFGAIHVPMEYPGVFNAAFGLSPCCLQLSEDLAGGNPAWNTTLGFASPADADAAMDGSNFLSVALLGIVSMFVPEPGTGDLHVRMPYAVDRQGFRINAEPTFSQFRDAFPIERLGDGGADGLRALSGLALEVGYSDQFTHIPVGTVAFSQRLSELGIPHVFHLYDGDHRIHMRERLTRIVLPFLVQHLVPAR